MIVDIIIILIVAMATFAGIKKGLISCVIDILAVIIALILAVILCRPITNVIVQETNFDESIKQTISQNIPLNDVDFKVEENSNLPKPIVDYINEITANVNTSKEDAIEVLSTELTMGIISVIVFIAIFIIVRIVLALVKIVSKLIDKIPGLKQINKLGGGICGAIEGIIIVYAIFAVLSMISPIISNTIILEQIYNSNIGSIMYNNNMILKSIYKM